MERLKLKLSNRKGFTLILFALMLMIFIGAAAMAVDVGHMKLNRADVHAAADAAALAGIEKYVSSGFDAGAAQTEASLYAAKFQADRQVLSVSSHTIGGWDSTKSYPSAFVALGTAGSTLADDVVVQHVGNYVFANALPGHIQTHTASATSIAIGIANKSVTRSTCVSPGLISYSALLSQLNTTDDPLTAADVAKLSTVPAQPFTFTIPNGNKVSGVKATDFVQINEPPTLYAAGAPGDPGAPNSADYRAAFSCDNEANPAVGVGDWVQPLDGQKAAQTRLGMANVAGQTIEVLLADTFGTPAGCPNGQGSGPLNGCFQVKYIAAFHVTAVGNMSISGYFTSISVPGGGIVTSSTSPGPVEQVTKIRLVY